MWGYRAIIGILACGAVAARGDEELDALQAQALLDAVRPAFVQVEYVLQVDKGEQPHSAGWSERCPNCGRFHGGMDGERYIEQERPKEAAGYLVAPDLVLTHDPQIEPRFVAELAVRDGAQRIPAQIDRYFEAENGVVLKLTRPHSGTPLQFQSGRPGPWFAVTYSAVDAGWSANVRPVSTALIVRNEGPAVISVPADSILVDGQGQPVGADFDGEIPTADWQGTPLSWPALGAAELDELLARTESELERVLLPAYLKYRSPAKDTDSFGGRFRDFDEREDSTTELHTSALVLSPDTLLVLAPQTREVTARLEHVFVTLPGGSRAEARFTHSLRDFGAFLAALDEPLPEPARIFAGDVRTLRGRLLPRAQVRVFGETRRVLMGYVRLPDFAKGHKGRVLPAGVPDAEPDFAFTTDGALVLAPLSVRRKSVSTERWEQSEFDEALMPVQYVRAALSDLAMHCDPANVPLSEEQENRLAWLGVELQGLDRELARVNHVSELTQDGEFGGLISHVYPGSPAEQAGLAPGTILLRVQAARLPQPVPIRPGGDDGSFFDAFPWDRLDDLPEEYFDQIPQPWPSVRTALNELLTEIGFGEHVQVECYHDGQLLTKEIEVLEGPPHYGSARRYKSDALGLTVRELTYEVQRYLQLKPDEPGVVISKIEQGSRGSVGGLKPFEIVTHVNNEPVRVVADFERLVTAAGADLRLDVKRMTRSRVVKIRMDAPLPASQPAADADDELGE